MNNLLHIIERVAINPFNKLVGLISESLEQLSLLNMQVNIFRVPRKEIPIVLRRNIQVPAASIVPENLQGYRKVDYRAGKFTAAVKLESFDGKSLPMFDGEFKNRGIEVVPLFFLHDPFR